MRAWRGRRSQTAFSRWLGYRSNIVYRWESGQCWPTASRALQIAQRTGVPVAQRLGSFFRVERPWLATQDPTSREGVAALLEDLRGGVPILDVARASGFSRFSIARWLKGVAEPRLPELLRLVDVLSLRLLDFAAVLAEPEGLPSIGADWKALQAAREAAFVRPWSHAVLRALELDPYRKLPAHEAGWVAARLGIPIEEETRCLALLHEAEQIRWQDGHWHVADDVAIDLRPEVQRVRALKAWAIDLARSRLEAGVDGVFGFNLFAASAADLEALREMHLAYFQRVQARIARSHPSECVALFSTQLVRLDEH